MSKEVKLQKLKRCNLPALVTKATKRFLIKKMIWKLAHELGVSSGFTCPASLSCLHGSIIATSTVLQIMEAFKTLHP